MEVFGLRTFLPSLKSIVVATTILVAAGGAYAGALDTSVFAVRRLSIVGGSPRVRAEVRRALAPELGLSLLRVDEGLVSRRAEKISDVISVRVDRSFPHTLRIRVSAERAVLLLRSVRQSWVISARGRVMRRIPDPRHSSLPRLWVPKGTPVAVGDTLGRYGGALAAAAVAPIASGVFPGGVQTVISTPTELTLVLRSGPQIRLGDIGDLHLKLAIAHRIIRMSGSAATTADYIDVSVPERPVLGPLNSQVTTTG